MYRVIKSLIHNPMIEELYDCKDTFLELDVMSKEIRNNLDSYIKLGLKRSGLTIIQNTYTGFDTEYKFYKDIYNELLSVQLAVCTRLVLKLPTPIKYYEARGINSFTGDIYEVIHRNPKIESLKAEKTINENILKLRALLYPEYDEAICKIIEGLKALNIPFMKKNESTYFLFDKSLLRT